MLYGRLTLVQPKHGEEKRVEEIIDRLTQLYRGKEGCVAQYAMAHRPDGRIAKVGIWKDKASADHAAVSDETMALRSHLIEAAEGQPEELALDVTAASGLGVEPIAS